jgi:hypothetical protein
MAGALLVPRARAPLGAGVWQHRHMRAPAMNSQILTSKGNDMMTATAHITFKHLEAHAVYHNIAESMFETSGDGGYLNFVKMTGAEEAWHDGATYPLTCTIPA